RLPAVTLTRPPRGEVFTGDKETLTVPLEARLDLPVRRHPYRATVLVNGTAPAEEPRVDEGARTLAARVALRPGPNRSGARLSNDGGTPPSEDEVEVQYLRPPTILELKQVAGGKRVLNLEAKVHTPLPLLPGSVTVTVNDGLVRPGRVRFDEAA